MLNLDYFTALIKTKFDASLIKVADDKLQIFFTIYQYYESDTYRINLSESHIVEELQQISENFNEAEYVLSKIKEVAHCPDMNRLRQIFENTEYIAKKIHSNLRAMSNLIKEDADMEYYF